MWTPKRAVSRLMNASAQISDDQPLPHRLCILSTWLPLVGQRSVASGKRWTITWPRCSRCPEKRAGIPGVALESTASMPPTICNSHAQRRRRSFPSSAPNRLGCPIARARASRLVEGFLACRQFEDLDSSICTPARRVFAAADAVAQSNALQHRALVWTGACTQLACDVTAMLCRRRQRYISSAALLTYA
jgi:hypothetical protein